MEQDVIAYLKNVADPTRAEHSARYFKTAPGQYGHGDKFLGIRVPVLRKAVTRFKELSLLATSNLLRSEYHEVRLFALLLLVRNFLHADVLQQEKIFKLYLKNKKYINNWDLVDSSAPAIVGGFLLDRDRAVLYELVQSTSLWDRRIAVLSTFYFIKHHQFNDSLKIAKSLIRDHEDLMHKAVGWMLREIGKRDRACEETFLKRHYANMPRTMLRYAIEKFPPTVRQKYLSGKM